MKVTPEYISDLVNFHSNTLGPEWTYDPARTDMRNLQAKGAAKVFNLLETERLALLADEVGMGKTIQALAVCSALWREKPDARVLILAPRDEIVRNWEREYQTFIRHHYRHNDNVVKSISGEEPVKRMVYSPNLYTLVHELQQGWGQLFIGKISSFSSLMSRKDVEGRLTSLNIRRLARIREISGRKEELNEEIARLLKREIDFQAVEGKPCFDLLIIDEAHYFRNKEGGSLRATSAREIFGDPETTEHVPLASRVLLMTATPNHNSSRDIGNIVSYFTRKYEDKDYQHILDQICVRRLRRLSTKGLNKYNYRKEIPSPSDFTEDPLAEMFFGLYQHELARKINQNKSERAGKRGVSRMMKYLEGVEFIPYEKPIVGEDTEDESSGNSSDYSVGTDADILLDISRKFVEIFGGQPKHPKYDRLVSDLTLGNRGEKAVVFVRRIPSVFEIAKRVIEYYDRDMWKQLQVGPLQSLTYERLTRRGFKNQIAETDTAQDLLLEDEELEKEEDRDIPSCKVLNLFKVVKGDSVKSTHAANFRLRFTHSKANVFAMFFSPGSDYFDEEYKEMTLHRFDVGKNEVENFFSSALIHRIDRIREEAVSKDIKSILLPKNPVNNKGPVENSLPTLLTIFWNQFLLDEDISEEHRALVTHSYKSLSHYEKESLSNFLEKGVVLASEAVVWFYRIFREIQQGRDESQVIGYLQFSDCVRKELRNRKLYTQIQDSIVHFKSIYTKVFSINGDRALLEEAWESFNNAQPIYPYNADNKSEKVRRCFNTPFYPDMLVATSVLQEGVNLQYFCSTIYHYGMAWTPGDNEQRIGRIDRMFGKIERRLEADQNSSLDIFYPYLKDTIDEEHLGRFAKRKFNEESLIDRGRAFEESADFDIEENDNDSWKNFLRKPDHAKIVDPFPVVDDHFKGIKPPVLSKEQGSLDHFFESIMNALEKLTDFDPKLYYINQDGSRRLLVDPTMPDGRKQPVIVELLFDHIGSGYHGHSVYCLRMRTPLEAASKFRDRKLRQKFQLSETIQSYYRPGTKFCLDPSQTGASSWGLYMAQELPLFVANFDDNPLSVGEVQDSFVQLVRCADEVEKELFDRDLKSEELNLPLMLPQSPAKKRLRQATRHPGETTWKREGGFLILETPLATANEPEKDAAVSNHRSFHVRVLYKNDGWVAQVAYPEKDAQEEELSILKKHLDVFTSNRKWLSKSGDSTGGGALE